jgi:hypothetical protein
MLPPRRRRGRTVDHAPATPVDVQRPRLRARRLPPRDTGPRAPHPAVDVARALPAAEIDIVTYFDRNARTTSEVDDASARALEAGMKAEDPVFLSTLSVSGKAFARRHPHITADSDRVRVLRSVLLKPEHALHTAWLVNRLEDIMTS